jgi:SAM-dependent methyltransferase
MTTPAASTSQGSGLFPGEYLCVDRFLAGVVEVQALKTALKLGVIDFVERHPNCTRETIGSELGLDNQGLTLLLDLLAANGVVETDHAGVRLTDRFTRALSYRDLLECKIEFADLLAPDVIERFDLLIADPGRFMVASRVFDLFDYRRALERTPENFAATVRWVRLTTALTRYEAGACLHHHDFATYRRVMDIGGNSGEFALQLCKAYPQLEVTVFDLPVVCDIGVEHLKGHSEADRIAFVRGDALRDPLPKGFDLITFKSMLHDWPQELVERLLTRAVESLNPGGTILIFERGPLEVTARPVHYERIPMLVFFRSFRSPDVYMQCFVKLGLTGGRSRKIALEMPFFMVTAQKP